MNPEPVKVVSGFFICISDHLSLILRFHCLYTETVKDEPLRKRLHLDRTQIDLEPVKVVHSEAIAGPEWSVLCVSTIFVLIHSSHFTGTFARHQLLHLRRLAASSLSVDCVQKYLFTVAKFHKYFDAGNGKQKSERKETND